MSKPLILGLIAIVLGASLGIAVEQSPVEAPLAKDTYPGLFSGALTSARLATLPAGILLRSGNLKLTQKDLDLDIAKAPATIRPQLKNNAFFALEDRATGDLLAAEARAWAQQNGGKVGAKRDELVRAYLNSFISTLTVADEEIRMFYDENKSMMGSATFDQAKEPLKDYLLDEKRRQAVSAHILTLSERTLVEVDKDWAAKQYVLAINNPVDKARKSGKPTMVDFGADKCRPCDMMTPILSEIKKTYAGKVNVVFVHVGKEQVLGARFGIEAIPVQVFYDKAGKEVHRHVGFFAKDQILSKLAEMGVR